MKRIVSVLVFVLLFSQTSRSQALIGFNMSDVRKEYPSVNWEYGKWGESNEYQTMSFEDNSIATIYYFNEKGICFSTAIIPKSQGILQAMIERYNSRYVIVDDTHWKFYTNGGVLKSYLKMTDENVYYFYWYM